MNDWYILDGRTPIKADTMTAAKWLADAQNKTVARNINDGVCVSTVFLGLDHRMREGEEPMLFESLVFGGPNDGEMARYCTYDAAESGHAELCARLLLRDYAPVTLEHKPTAGGDSPGQY
jgi:hypothetical protein